MVKQAKEALKGKYQKLKTRLSNKKENEANKN